MLDQIAPPCGGRPGKMMPGKPDGPHTVLLALDARAGRRRGGDSTPVSTAFGDLRLPETFVGRLGASATTGARKCRLHKKITSTHVVFGSVGDAAMSDLEFKRELSPDQLREALSLLDRAAGAQPQNLQVGDLSSAEGGDPGADQASATMDTQGRLAAIEDLQQPTKHLNLVAAAFFGLGIAATATLALLSWSDRAATPPSVSEIAHEQLSNQPPGQLVAIPPADQSPGRSERRPSTPEVTGSVGYPSRDDDQPAVKGAANTASAIPYAAQTATVTSLATGPPWRDKRASRKPKGAAWLHARAGRVAAAKQRFSRRHWQARAEIKCFLFVCW